ncbi:MAG: type II toxin-antitoxin system PemK/MazF family toxin [Chloroflexi bacterium]|nr:type II toxin-antitoxin system PemK/MazF family toxin [Chloroflexota bacterium]
MPKDSVALVFQIRTLDKSRLIQKAGHLSGALMQKIDAALEIHLNL